MTNTDIKTDPSQAERLERTPQGRATVWSDGVITVRGKYTVVCDGEMLTSIDGVYDVAHVDPVLLPFVQISMAQCHSMHVAPEMIGRAARPRLEPEATLPSSPPGLWQRLSSWVLRGFSAEQGQP